MGSTKGFSDCPALRILKGSVPSVLVGLQLRVLLVCGVKGVGFRVWHVGFGV